MIRKIYPAPNKRYHMHTVPCDDELHAHLVRSHAEANRQRERQKQKKIKFAPHLRDLWRIALDGTAFPAPKLKPKTKSRRIE